MTRKIVLSTVLILAWPIFLLSPLSLTPVAAQAGASCCPGGTFYCPGSAGSGGGCYNEAACQTLSPSSVCGGDVTQSCNGSTCQPKTTPPSTTCADATDIFTGGQCCNPTTGACSPPLSSSCPDQNGISYQYDPATNLCLATGTSGPAGEKKVFLCLTGSCQTAIGNIGTNPASLVGRLLQLFMGVAGGITLVMIIIAGYQVLTSAGDPQKLAAAKELFISVFTGIILIVLSLVLLQTIGVDILQLPPLGGHP